jgi:hypothetical protein
MQEYCNGPLIELAESFERVGVLELQSQCLPTRRVPTRCVASSIVARL